MSEEQITKKVIEILRGYVKDASLLEKATAETHILKDLKVNSARLVDIISSARTCSGPRSMTKKPTGSQRSGTPSR